MQRAGSVPAGLEFTKKRRSFELPFELEAKIRQLKAAFSLRLFRDKCFVGGGVEQLFQFGGIGEFHLDDPRAVRVRVDLVGFVFQLLIDRGHLAADGRIEIADGLHAFHRAECGIGGYRVTHLGRVDVDDVAQRVLRVVGDADAADVAFDRDPFVFAACSDSSLGRAWRFCSFYERTKS